MQIPGYENCESAGENTVATFWHAYQRSLDRQVGLVVIKPQALLDPHVRSDFLRDVRMAAGIKHPALAQVYDVMEMGATLVVTMEHLTGLSLRQLMRQRGELEENKALTIARWVAEGLGHVHTKTGYSHLALTPDYIWIEPSGQVKITGFGFHALFAKRGLADEDLPYLAPEQIETGPTACDFRADLYALGALLYAMVTGRAPFEGRPVEEVRPLTLSGQAPAPMLLKRGGTSQAFNQMLARLMIKTPDQRYGNWLAVMQEMDRILDGAKMLIVTKRSGLSTIQLPAGGVLRRAPGGTGESAAPPVPASAWGWGGLGLATALVIIWVALGVKLDRLPPPVPDPLPLPPLEPGRAPARQPAATPDSPAVAEPTDTENPVRPAEEGAAASPDAPGPEPAETPVDNPAGSTPDVQPPETPATEPEPPAAPPPPTFETLTDEVVRRLLAGDTATAVMAVDLASREPEWAGQREKLEDVKRVVRRVADPLGLALAELGRKQGRKLRVTLGGQPKDLTMQRVEGRRVTFMEEVRVDGAVAHRLLIVDAGDLSPAALAGLLEAGEGPEFALARLILWNRAGMRDRASALAPETGPLASAFGRHFGGGQP